MRLIFGEKRLFFKSNSLHTTRLSFIKPLSASAFQLHTQIMQTNRTKIHVVDVTSILAIYEMQK